MNGRETLPAPRVGENPVQYADQLGQWYSQVTPSSHRKELGQYFTPTAVAYCMADMVAPDYREHLTILDPGAGAGILSAAALERIRDWPAVRSVSVVAFETDPSLCACLEASLEYCRQSLASIGVRLDFRIRPDDFVLANGHALGGAVSFTQDPATLGQRFDLAIGNPPYFKIGKADPRAQAVAGVVHGQPNIYALFMAVSAALLREGGQLVFITPRSYAAGPYFRAFRRRFFSLIRPERLHLFESRRDTFRRDDVLQENVILQGIRRSNWWEFPEDGTVTVSRSSGAGDIGAAHKRRARLAHVLDARSRDWVLRIPASDYDDAVRRVVDSWSGSLPAYGMEISTGPVVAFRAKPLLTYSCSNGGACAPLLWMQNIHAMQIRWPLTIRGKPQHIAISDASARLLVADRNYVLLRRFSAKEQMRRLTAAPLLAGRLGSQYVGIENHVNYIYRRRGSLTDEEAYGLAAVLNSELADGYFRTFNGNTQVNATELRWLPLPPLDAIKRIGRAVMMLKAGDGCEEVVSGELASLPSVASPFRVAS